MSIWIKTIMRHVNSRPIMFSHLQRLIITHPNNNSPNTLSFIQCFTGKLNFCDVHLKSSSDFIFIIMHYFLQSMWLPSFCMSVCGHVSFCCSLQYPVYIDRSHAPITRLPLHIGRDSAQPATFYVAAVNACDC